MPDASPMDPAIILQRVDEIEAQLPYIGPRPISASEAIRELCQLLRTALADTRRVDRIVGDAWLDDDNGSSVASREHLDALFATYAATIPAGAKPPQLGNAVMAATPRET